MLMRKVSNSSEGHSLISQLHTSPSYMSFQKYYLYLYLFSSHKVNIICTALNLLFTQRFIWGVFS